MKVICALPDEAGPGHYRVKYPGTAAADHEGIEVEFRTELDLHVTPRERGGFGRVDRIEKFEADVFVIGRPLRRMMAEVIPLIQAQGIPVVVDVDDDFSCVDTKHQGYRFYQPKTSPESNLRHLGRACALADLVTCTTPALARRYGAHGRVQVLPNCVPRSMLGTVADRDGRTVGWSGFVAVHPNDLQVTRGGVAEAMRDAGARFLNVGSGDGVRELLRIEPDQEFAVTGPQSFQDYPYAVARLDAGIVPLAETRFNEAKSCLKGLEYAALGVPFVASNLPDYARIAVEGIGWTAKNKANHWRRCVRALLGPEGREQAAIAQHTVRERYTYEGNAWRWVEAWERARAAGPRAGTRNLPKTKPDPVGQLPEGDLSVTVTPHLGAEVVSTGAPPIFRRST